MRTKPTLQSQRCRAITAYRKLVFAFPAKVSLCMEKCLGKNLKLDLSSVINTELQNHRLGVTGAGVCQQVPQAMSTMVLKHLFYYYYLKKTFT